MRRVINAAGIVVHTNLGRAPLPGEAVAAVLDTARGYSNLEFDLAAGERTSASPTSKDVARPDRRRVRPRRQQQRRRGAALSRGPRAGPGSDRQPRELVEIGGSFRIPDIMAESGARLVEVGTTNRTRLSDYENAVTGQTALLLKVHPSNFSMHGFTEEVRTADLARLGARAGIRSWRTRDRGR